MKVLPRSIDFATFIEKFDKVAKAAIGTMAGCPELTFASAGATQNLPKAIMAG